MMLRVEVIPCLSDNYAYLVECSETGQAAIVDPSEAGPVLAKTKGKKIQAIWCTHHHPDHVGGNLAVSAAHGGVPIVGHASDKGRIPGQTRFLEEGESFTLGDLPVRVLHIPGHTLGAIAYVVEGPRNIAVFTGDTLFLAGCGRMFEGTPAMMQASLAKLAALPPEARIFCGHEYTAANLRFAAHAEPTNEHVRKRAEAVAAARAAAQPTVPGTLGEELRTNPFLRLDSKELRATLGIAPELDAGAAFGVARAAKDAFKG
jgi:hydroxyacylglutathione hydrolase